MNKYKLSVIITSFNKSNYLMECIESVINQRLRNIQIIVVDDGSTDSTSKVISQIESLFPSVIIINKVNQGVSSARNVGLNYAEGEYITFLDGDDYVTEDGYYKLYTAAKRSKSEIAIGNIQCFDESLRTWTIPYMQEIFKTPSSVNRNAEKYFDFTKSPSVCNKLFHLDWLKGNALLFDEELSVGEDQLFSIKALFYAQKATIIDSIIVNYRVCINEFSSLSRRTDLHYFRCLTSLQKKLFKFLSEEDFKYNLKIVDRQVSFYLDSLRNKTQYFNSSEFEELFLISKEFVRNFCEERFQNIKESLDINNKLLYEILLKGDQSDFSTYFQENMNDTKHIHIIKKTDGYYYSIVKTFNKYAEVLKVDKLELEYKVEVLSLNRNILEIGGYAFIRNYSISGIRKSIVFKMGDKIKSFKLINSLRTDVSYIYTRNSIDYNDAGFKTIQIDICNNLGVGKWEVFLRLETDDVLIERRIHIPLAYLRNQLKANSFSDLTIVPEFRSNLLTLNISHRSLFSCCRLAYNQMKRNVRYELGLVYRKDVHAFFVIQLYKLLNRILRRKNVWVIGERKDTAQDNSFYLFKYIRSKIPNQKIYYIIDKNSKDYKNIRKLGNVIEHGSLKHTLYMLISNISINSYMEAPNMYTNSYKNIIKYYPEWQQNKKVFLQHGVIGVSRVNHSLHKNRVGYSLFIVSSEQEKSHIIEEFGYENEEVVVTGLARWDGLRDCSQGNEILLMPTWRNWIKTEKQLIQSKYFKTYISFLENKKLHQVLEEKDLILTFYPHYQIQRLLEKVELPEFHERIKVVMQGEETVQQLLVRHRLLITDYSTVSFDFAYMNKQVLFFQFDYDQFFSSHYNKGPVEFKEYFGEEIITEVEELIEQLKVNTLDFKDIYKLNNSHLLKRCDQIFEKIKEIN